MMRVVCMCIPMLGEYFQEKSSINGYMGYLGRWVCDGSEGSYSGMDDQFQDAPLCTEQHRLRRKSLSAWSM